MAALTGRRVVDMVWEDLRPTARLLGPTGGYLMAYPIAAFVTGLDVLRSMTDVIQTLRLARL